MDYEEEQTNEIEALGSIYPEEFKKLEDCPCTFTIEVNAESDGYSSDDKIQVSCNIKFTYTDKYPDEKPIIEFDEYETLDTSDVDDLLAFMDSMAEENLGTVMVFTIISAVQEKLTEMASGFKERREQETDEAEKRKAAEEMKRFDGTRVTVETFLAWKSAFDEEMLKKSEKARLQAEQQAALSQKLTGRQLFERDAKLGVSDLDFLEEGDEEVQIDETLFQDLDHLDLAAGDELPDTDDDDDPDYVPT